MKLLVALVFITGVVTVAAFVIKHIGIAAVLFLILLVFVELLTSTTE